MDIKIQEKLELAIMRYVDSLDIDGLVNYVSADLWEYYTDSADECEAIAFIDEMQIEES